MSFVDPFGLKAYIAVSGSAGGGVGIIAGEGGEFVAVDPASGKFYIYRYLGGGFGLGFGGSANIEVGVIDMDTPLDITGLGLGVSAFAAAGKGGAIQITGTGPFGNGAMGAVGGVAGGVGAGVSGLATYTWLVGEGDLKSVSGKVLEALRHRLNGVSDQFSNRELDQLRKLINNLNGKK